VGRAGGSGRRHRRLGRLSSLLRPTGAWTPYVYAASLRSSSRARKLYAKLNGSRVPDSVPDAALLNASQIWGADTVILSDQRTWAVGTSYALASGQVLKAEWQRTHVGRKSAFLDVPEGTPKVAVSWMSSPSPTAFRSEGDDAETTLLFVVGLFAGVGPVPLRAAGNVVLIGHPSVPRLDRMAVERIYTGKIVEVGDQRIMPLDLPPTAPCAAAFSPAG
jgi:hypothetical protein